MTSLSVVGSVTVAAVRLKRVCRRSGLGVAARWASASSPSIANASAVMARDPAITPGTP